MKILRALAVAGIEPREARLLLAEACGFSQASVIAQGEQELPPEIEARFMAMVARRRAGEPIAYIVGHREFYGLPLSVGPSVLIPRPETELLVELALNRIAPNAAASVLDLGTGSGAIALAIAADWPSAIVTATDASDQALAVARANASACGLAGRVRFIAGDWFEAISPDERFEVIASNPPYIAEPERDTLHPQVRDFEPGRALFSGATGLEALRTIVDEAPRHLVADGLLALELAEARAGEVAGWLEGAHDWRGVDLRDDLAGRPRVLLARRETGPAIAPAQWVEER